MMSAHHDLIEQLEQAFAQSDLRQRAETLRRLTDLFVTGAETFTDEQIELFDEVMIRLVEEIDVSARAVFGRRMAEVAQAPARVMRGLALDDAIEVAGPVLRGSERLDDSTLIETARTKSQQHLMAIARRKMIDRAGDRRARLARQSRGRGQRGRQRGRPVLRVRLHDAGRAGARRPRPRARRVGASGDPAPAPARAVRPGERDRAPQPGSRRPRQGRPAAGGDRAGLEPAADAAARGVDDLFGGPRAGDQAASRRPARRGAPRRVRGRRPVRRGDDRACR